MGLREYLRREVQGWDPVGEELSYGDEAPTKVSWKVDNLEEEEEQ